MGLEPQRSRATVAVSSTGPIRPGGTFDPGGAGRSGRSQALELRRASHWAVSIEVPPFYGYLLRPGITFTYLGPVVDACCARPSPTAARSDNLFAAGRDHVRQHPVRRATSRASASRSAASCGPHRRDTGCTGSPNKRNKAAHFDESGSGILGVEEGTTIRRVRVGNPRSGTIRRVRVGNPPSATNRRVRVGGACGRGFVRVRVGGACGPPPPVAAPLVPRCALLPAATPRVRAAALRTVSPTVTSTVRLISPVSAHRCAACAAWFTALVFTSAVISTHLARSLPRTHSPRTQPPRTQLPCERNCRERICRERFCRERFWCARV